MNPCTCRVGCKFCRNSDYTPPLKFEVGQRVQSKSGYKGRVAHRDHTDRTYRVEWENSNISASWIHEVHLEVIGEDTVDYRALIQTELNEVEAEILKLRDRVEFLEKAKNVLDELDKKA